MIISHRGLIYTVQTAADVVLLCGLAPCTDEERTLLALYRVAPIVGRAMVAVELIDYVARHHSPAAKGHVNGADVRRFYRMSVRRLSRKKRNGRRAR